MFGKEFLPYGQVIVRQPAMPGFGAETKAFSAPVIPTSQINQKEIQKRIPNKGSEVEVWRGKTILVGSNIPAREPSGITKTCDCGLPLHFDRVNLGHARKNGEELQNVINVLSALRCPDHGVRGNSKIFRVNTDKTEIREY